MHEDTKVNFLKNLSPALTFAFVYACQSLCPSIIINITRIANDVQCHSFLFWHSLNLRFNGSKSNLCVCFIDKFLMFYLSLFLFLPGFEAKQSSGEIDK